MQESGKLSQQMAFNRGMVKTNRHVSVLNHISFIPKAVPAVRRCRKTQHDCFADIKKAQIFQLVHAFIHRLLHESSYLQQVIHETQFGGNRQKSQIIDDSIDSNDSAEVLDLREVGSVEINVITVEREEMEDENQGGGRGDLLGVDKKNSKKPAKSTKKISIMLQCDDLDLTSQTSSNYPSSTLFSSQSLSNISSIQIIEQQLTMKMVEKIYEQPQPFLINLSVCLMLKYLQRSRTKLDKKNVCWILSVGTIVAYKLYYDEPVEGLVESFAQVLKLSKEDVVVLERRFLEGIDHQAVISSQQYHSTLYHIIKQGKQ